MSNFVGRRINVDDLIDSSEVAKLLGLGSLQAVAVYLSRGPIPAAVVDREPHRARLWLRQDINRWLSSREGSR